MKVIYVQTHHVTRQTDLSGVFANANNIRTNYPFKIDGGYKQVICHATFAGCTNIEVVAFTKHTNNVFYSSRVNYLFQYCRKLKEVIGIIRIDYASSSEKYEKMFYQCSALVSVSLRGVKYDISVESENGVHAVTVKSSSQSFDHSGDGGKCLLDNGQYGPTLPFNNGTEGQILKIVGGKPTWVDPS